MMAHPGTGASEGEAGSATASPMEAQRSLVGHDYVVEGDDLIDLELMQKKLEGKDHEIDQLKQELHRLRQYTRQKEEAYTSKECERRVMEENKRLKRNVESLQADVCQLQQSMTEDHGDCEMSEQESDLVQELWREIDTMKERARVEKKEFTAWHEHEVGRLQSELERAQQGHHPPHSAPPTRPTEATDEGELFDAHVVKHQRQSEEEMRLRDEVCQLTAQLEEAQRNVDKLREQLRKVSRELVKTKDSLMIAQESSNPDEQAFTEDRLSNSKQVNHELLSKIMTLEQELEELRQREERARKEKESLHDNYKKMADALHKKKDEVKALTKQINDLQSQVEVTQVQANVFEEDFKHEREDRTKAASRHEEEVQRLKFQLDEEIAHAKDMIEPMELVKQRLEVSLQTAQEEVQVKTTQLKQYKKQVDALKEQVALHEEQSMSLSKEMFKVREELEKTKKEKTKLERAKSTTKLLKGLAETKVVPEEKYCKVEADYDQALQKIAELQEEMDQREAAYRGLQSKFRVGVDQPSTSTDLDHALLIPEEPPSPRLHARGKTPPAITQQPTASRPMPRAREKPLSNPRPSPQTHSLSHSPSRARYPTPPSQPRHAPKIPSQPPPVGPAQPQQPATSSTRPPERGPSRSKQPSERNQPPARPPPPQPRGTEQDHLASHQPLVHQQGYFEEREGDITGLAPQREQPREPQSQAAESFTQPGGYYPPEDPNISRGFQSQAVGSYVQQNAGGNFPTGGNEPQMMQSQVAMQLAQQPPRGNFPQGSNEPNVPRGLQIQRSMPFTLQPSDRNLPPGSNHPQRATLPSAYGGTPSQPVPTTVAPVADEGQYSVSPPDLMSLPEPVVDYREPQFERQSSYPRPEQDYTPHEQPPQSDHGGNNYYLQGQQHHHAQMGISLGLNERRVRGSASPQSVHSPVSPQQHPSPVSPTPLPGHAPSPTRPPLYQSQTAPPLNSSGAQVQVPRPLSLGEAAFSPVQASKSVSQGKDENKLIRGIDTEMQAELVAYTVSDTPERPTQAHVPFDPNLVCPTCKRQFRYGEIQRFRSHVKECALQEGTVV